MFSRKELKAAELDVVFCIITRLMYITVFVNFSCVTTESHSFGFIENDAILRHEIRCLVNLRIKYTYIHGYINM